MIIVKINADAEKCALSLKVSGHAGMAERGHDVICSAASILAYTLAQEVDIAHAQGKTKYPPRHKLDKDGYASVYVRCKPEFFKEMVIRYIFAQTGYVLLAHNYPDYVTIDEGIGITGGDAEDI